MSTIIAHLPVILMFQKTLEMLAIGLPIQRASAKEVLKSALLSKGACRMRPMTGSTWHINLRKPLIALDVTRDSPRWLGSRSRRPRRKILVHPPRKDLCNPEQL